MKKAEKVIFYVLISFLVVNRLVAIVNMTYFFDLIEKQTLFTASAIAQGIPPLRSFFQVNMTIGGCGSLIYSLCAVPFIMILGKSYFSLRLASIIFLIITIIITYKFCTRYFNSRIAFFTLLIFVVTPYIITNCSIVGDGRHFHLNLFFIVSVYLLAKIKEQ